MKKSILIVGGTGFIGKNLINKLKFLNFKILSLSKKKSIPKSRHNIEYKSLDIVNTKKLKRLNEKKFNIVINLGGNIDHQNPQETRKAHYYGLKNLFNNLSLKNLDLFIQIGSSLEYGPSKSPQIESQLCKPNSCYGKAKLSATKYLIKNLKSKKFKLIILRPYQIYGPFQKLDRLIPQTINCYLKKKKFECSEGNQKRDFLYVEDFVSLILKIINKKKIKSGIYNVGSGKPVKVKDIIKLINKLIKFGKPVFGKIKMRKDEAMSLYPNTKKIKKNFNWKPKTSLKSGLKKTIKYYELYRRS